MAKGTAISHEQLSDSDLLAHLDPDLLPRHVAVIMDGNGRWAEARGLPRIAGHREGVKSVREITTLCRELGIGVLTIYAFSLENWKRPSLEISALMQLLEHYLKAERDELIEKGIRFQSIGRVDMLPPSAVEWVRTIERDTGHLQNMVLNVALSYSGRAEIADAARKLASDCRAGDLDPDAIDERTFERSLLTHGLPDPDLLIRTSGETRISNFLLWQLAYTELYFTPTLWPDFRRREALLALLEYQRRERRFGRVSKAVSPRRGL